MADYIPPNLVDPYPDTSWSEITDFSYDSPLYLFRAIEAVKAREGRDANYIVGKDYTVGFHLDGEARSITVPRGTITDLASVPSLARAIIGRVGPHLEASIVHDFLYIAWQDLAGKTAEKKDRDFADALMRVALKEAGTGCINRFLIILAVRVFGWFVYRKKETRPRYVDLPPQGP
jgi:hypothetical protein